MTDFHTKCYQPWNSYYQQTMNGLMSHPTQYLRYTDIIGSSIDPVTHLLFSFPLTSPSPVNLILLHHQELLFLLCMLDYRNPDLPATINSPPSQFTQHGLHDTIQQHSGTFRPQWQQTMELPDVNTITTPGQPSYNRIFFTIKGSSSVFIPQFMDIIRGLTTSSHNYGEGGEHQYNSHLC